MSLSFVFRFYILDEFRWMVLHFSHLQVWTISLYDELIRNLCFYGNRKLAFVKSDSPVVFSKPSSCTSYSTSLWTYLTFASLTLSAVRYFPYVKGLVRILRTSLLPKKIRIGAISTGARPLVHKLPRNLGTTSKFYAPEGWREFTTCWEPTVLEWEIDLPAFCCLPVNCCTFCIWGKPLRERRWLY